MKPHLFGALGLLAFFGLYGSLVYFAQTHHLISP